MGKQIEKHSNNKQTDEQTNYRGDNNNKKNDNTSFLAEVHKSEKFLHIDVTLLTTPSALGSRINEPQRG